MNKIIVFTDGSFSRKYKTCGYGVHFPNKEIDDISEPFKLYPATNQRAELYGIYAALNKITNSDETMNFDSIDLYTDSMYSINSLTKWIYGWIRNNWIGTKKRQVKNKDIIEKIYDIMDKYKYKIKLFHVNSHTNKTDFYSLGNNIADTLANDGARKNIINKPIKNIINKSIKKVINKPIKKVINKPIKKVINKPIKKVIKQPTIKIIENSTETKNNLFRPIEETLKHSELKKELTIRIIEEKIEDKIEDKIEEKKINKKETNKKETNKKVRKDNITEKKIIKIIETEDDKKYNIRMVNRVIRVM